MSQPKPNFTLIQAARGIAATWVVLFHIYMGERIGNLTAVLPDWLVTPLFGYGSAGVAIFFALSGFVITHSLANKKLDGQGFATFIARRSVRLDPPYWASMLLAVGSAMVMAHLHGAAYAPPSTGAVLAHILYLQELLGIPEIERVYWTLTYEIQFYLVVALAWLLVGKLERRMGADRARAGVFLPLTLLAFVAAIESRDWAPHGLFVNMWHAFFAGVLAYEAGYRRRSPILLFALCLVMLVVAPFRAAVFNAPCAVTALLLFLASRTGYLVRGLAGAGWQFLGRISYSLYLVHVPLLILGFGLWGRLAGRGVIQDLAGLVIVGGGVIGAAGLFWWLIERPCHALATRLTLRRKRPVPLPT
jgi:peptidoglycan/LPS O-acetylase OafA/YrhL